MVWRGELGEVGKLCSGQVVRSSTRSPARAPSR